MRKNLRIVGCLLLTAIIAWKLDWGRFAAAFARLDLTYWLLAVGVYLGSQIVSSLRWQLLAGALGFGGSTLRYIAYYFIGMFFSLALPSSVGGDVARGLYLAGQETGAKKTRRLEAFLSIFAERLSGVLMLVVMACAAAPFCPVALPAWIVACVALIGAGALAGVGLMLFIPARLSRGRGIRARLASVAMVYRYRPTLLLGSMLLSIVVQVASVVQVALCGAALGLTVPPLYYAVMVPLVALLMLLPISINGMGLREMGFVLFLSSRPLEIDQTAAVGLGLLSFAATSLPALGGAFVILFGRFSRLETQNSGTSVEVRPDDEALGGDPAQGRARQSRAAA